MKQAGWTLQKCQFFGNEPKWQRGNFRFIEGKKALQANAKHDY